MYFGSNVLFSVHDLVSWERSVLSNENKELLQETTDGPGRLQERTPVKQS